MVRREGVRVRIATSSLLVFLLSFFLTGTIFGIFPWVVGPASQPVPVIGTASDSLLTVNAKLIETVCESKNKIDYSLVEFNILDGLPPYTLTIVNSQSEVSGPYTLSKGVPVRVKVYGGDSFTITIRSKNEESWEGILSLPAEDKYCKNAVTRTPTSLTESTSTWTPIPVIESTHTLTMTNTLLPSVSNTPVPSSTPSPRLTQPTKTNVRTSQPVTSTSTRTATSRPTSTVISGFQTNTQRPPTTAVPPSRTTTNTPTLPPTNTPTPQPTSTPFPQFTAFLTPFNPNPRACEDGIDNDKDGLIDYPSDSDCIRPSDNSESR